MKEEAHSCEIGSKKGFSKVFESLCYNISTLFSCRNYLKVSARVALANFIYVAVVE